jgi:segregation and condensation protein A
MDTDETTNIIKEDIPIKTESSNIKEETPKTNEYWAKLTEYEGPLDILLHFVKEDELNIYDIPISKITRDFLNYLNYIQALDIELAGEFLLMAAELMKIKARMLIPQISDSEADEEDPRLTLIRKLLEYKRFKDAAAELGKYEEDARLRYFRKYFKKDAKEYEYDVLNDAGLQSLTIFNLIKGYKHALTSIKKDVVHPIELLQTTPEIQREFLINFFMTRTSVDFKELISMMEEKMLVICTFLSILQLALEGYIRITLNGRDMSEFSLSKIINEQLN